MARLLAREMPGRDIGAGAGVQQVHGSDAIACQLGQMDRVQLADAEVQRAIAVAVDGAGLHGRFDLQHRT